MLIKKKKKRQETWYQVKSRTKKGLKLKSEKHLTLAALVNYKTYIKFISYKTVQLKIDI